MFVMLRRSPAAMVAATILVVTGCGGTYEGCGQNKVVIKQDRKAIKQGGTAHFEVWLATGEDEFEPSNSTWSVKGEHADTLVVDDRNERMTLTAPASQHPGTYEVTVTTESDGSATATIAVVAGETTTTGPDATPSDVAPYEDEEDLGPEKTLVKTGNLMGVVNGGKPVEFTISVPTMITYINTYHWNDGHGAKAGKAFIKDASGKVVGSWAVTTEPGQGGVPNAYWIATPDVVLPPGTFTVADSSPGTWATNSDAGGKGMAEVRGRAVGM